MKPQNIADSSHISTEEAQAELDEVLHSRIFERSEKLQRFLRYVCDLTLRGGSAKLNEDLIGIGVFHRGGDCFATEDSGVALQGHLVRQTGQEQYGHGG